MSASVRRARAWLSLPMVPSKTSFFFSWSFKMRSSIEPAMTSRTAVMGRCWPSRCVRSSACSSAAGFHHGSSRKVREAAVRLSATPPALSEIRKTRTDGSESKAWMMRSRAGRLILPSSFTHRTPAWVKRCSTRSSIDVNCENTMDLHPGSSCWASVSSCSRASIFVDDLNPLPSWCGGTRDRMPLEAPPCAALERPALAVRSTVSGAMHAGHCAALAADDPAPAARGRFALGDAATSPLPSSASSPDTCASSTLSPESNASRYDTTQALQNRWPHFAGTASSAASPQSEQAPDADSAAAAAAEPAAWEDAPCE
mmetsp:Transcript_2556/g.10129  ORF Transcript_2556/g.10129 Transcript_2556/m.10129 type:complete len:314 (+) Transcript_2556:312-1253(+)